MQERLLLVEDDRVLNQMIAYNLCAKGYEVVAALNAAEGEQAMARQTFALALLDVGLPDGDGFALCKKLKAMQPETIVLFLTANDCESDQIRGYELGAVDYITKPFYIGALERKIRALLAMAARQPTQHLFDDGRLLLDFSTQSATYDGKTLSFTPMEYKVLNLFRKHPKQVLTRRQMLEKLWDSDLRFVEEHTLTATVSRIRGKLEAVGASGYIKTVYGMGYQWMGGDAAWNVGHGR
ncbi:MAG: response regulator transcription factor [Peptococcaceae bacterium]|nr:response regulator transcription factor [Peptococcaceae bacterium]